MSALSKLARMLAENPQFRRWYGDSPIVDEEGAPRLLYRGLYGHKQIPEAALRGEANPGYASFLSEHPAVAASYAVPDADPRWGSNAVGATVPLFVKASRLREFPVGKHFDKFGFDEYVRRLPAGEVGVARKVIDYGPRASYQVDPEKLYTYGHDVYGVAPGTEMRSLFDKYARGGHVR